MASDFKLPPRAWLTIGLVCLETGLRAEPAPPRPPIFGLCRVSIGTENLARSRAYYENYLGFAEMGAVAGPGGQPMSAWIKIDDRQMIELSPAPEPAPAHRARLSVRSIGFETTDAQGMRDYLASRGVKAPGRQELPRQVLAGPDGDPHFFAADPEGHTIEFVQYTPGGLTRRMQGRLLGPGRLSNRMSHAGLPIENSDLSMGFYRDVLGFRELTRSRLGGGSLRVPEGSDWVELMHATPVRLPRINHFCLEVTDVAVAMAKLTERPRPPGGPPDEKVTRGFNRKLLANSFDPDGTRVEIMEARIRPENALPRRQP